MESNITVRKKWEASSAMTTLIDDNSFHHLGITVTTKTGSIGHCCSTLLGGTVTKR
jgi:hypothetical protein